MTHVNRHTGGLENLSKNNSRSTIVNRHTGGLEKDAKML